MALEIAQQTFYQTVRHYAGGDLDAAVAAAQSIAGAGELYAQAARWLAKVAQGGETGAYLDADAFAAFIRGGGNIALYAAVESIVATAWDDYRPATILDIGPGDGKVIAGALRRTRLQLRTSFDLVEPAVNLLPKAVEQLSVSSQKVGANPCGCPLGQAQDLPLPQDIEKIQLSQHTPQVEVRGFNGTIQSFMAEAPPTARWDLCQSTWSLQNLSPTERVPLFRWLRERCATLLMAEFDVQTEMYPLLSPERIRLIHDKYVAGIAEYTGKMDPVLEERVKQGFLMPVLFGYFRSGAGRSTCEQTMGEWTAEIAAGGFRDVQRKLIYPYWWANAYLLIAHA
jgi:hypothetical protein